MDRLASTRDILGDLIAFATVSADSNLELIAYAADALGAVGARTTMLLDETHHKANLFATLGPEIDGGIVLSGHTDVVPADEGEWTGDPFEMRAANGRLYGRGSCDMKGFIAACLAIAPDYAELELTRPVHFSFTYDEEVGCLGARQLVDELQKTGLRPAAAIIGEPTQMRIIEGHKGCCEYTTTFTGLEGHGSRPELGVNAVEYAARYIAKLMQLGEELIERAPPASQFEPPWSTIQVGRVEGGSARNVIAGRCCVEWERRPVSSADLDHVKAVLADYVSGKLLPRMRAGAPRAEIITEVVGEVIGLEPVDDNEARRIVTELTGANTTDLAAFGTEAGLFQSIGMSAVVCGPGSSEQAHKPDEYVELDQLAACLKMLEGLSSKLTD